MPRRQNASIREKRERKILFSLAWQQPGRAASLLGGLVTEDQRGSQKNCLVWKKSPESA